VDYDYFAKPGAVPSAEPVASAPTVFPVAPPPAVVPPPSPPPWAVPDPMNATVLPAVGVTAPAAVMPGGTISPDERTMLATSAATSYEHMQGAPSYYLPSSRLGFFGSVRVGFRMIPVCWAVLMQEMALLVVPIVVLLIGTLAVLGYSAAFGGVEGLVAGGKGVSAIRLFPMLAFLMVLSVVGQAVIVAASTDILEGHRSSFGTAWLVALNQLPRLALFGIVYAGERTLTGLLRGRSGWSPTSIAANAIDRAWDFATFLAIPVLLYENATVFDAVKRSGKLVAQRWGVQLTARSVLGVAVFVVSIPFLLIGMLVAVGVSAPLGVVLILITLLGQVAVAGAMTGVLSAALYRFGTAGLVAPGFSEADMWAAFDRR
jgi:Family of unknown function (DUF6159)